MAKAISLWQPWASLMAAGYKRIETRSWPPRGLKPGELVAIHAAKRWTSDARETCQEWPFRDCLALAAQRGLWDFDKPPLGAVVAIARFHHYASCLGGFDYDAMTDEEYEFGNFHPDRYGWVFSEVRPLKPIETKGMQGIFSWTPPANLADLYLEPINSEAHQAATPHNDDECPECGGDLEHVPCPNCGGMRVEHATGWYCGECDEDGEVLMCAQPGCERRGVVVEVSA